MDSDDRAANDDGEELGGGQWQGRAGPRTILLRRYRQILGTAIVRANADLKLNRLGFIKPQANRAGQYAINVKQRHQNLEASTPYQVWFEESHLGAYQTYQQFLAGSKYDMGGR